MKTVIENVIILKITVILAGLSSIKVADFHFTLVFTVPIFSYLISWKTL